MTFPFDPDVLARTHHDDHLEARDHAQARRDRMDDHAPLTSDEELAWRLLYAEQMSGKVHRLPRGNA